MSRVDELIEEFCPNGVEFRELQELFTTKGGYTPSKGDASAWADGTVPWFRMEDIRENGRILGDSMQRINKNAVKGGRLFPANSILVATSATIGEHALITVPHLSNQRFTSLTLKPTFTDVFDTKFIFYYCYVLDEWCRNNTTTSSFSSVDMAGFKKFKFPVPPLEVQREIVRILDQFTQLEAELEAELDARRRQYEHYSAELLDLVDDPELAVLRVDEICTVNRGVVISKDYLRENPGPFPVYSSQTVNEGVFGYIDTFAFNDEESITWTTDGANAGSVFYHKKKKFTITNVCGRLVVRSSTVLARYLYFQLRYRAKAYVNAGMGNPKLMANHMSAVRIPVPLLEEQRRIVSLLDKFDALVNDLSVGLPAELTARRKQYEYYRDQLLTFKEIVA